MRYAQPQTIIVLVLSFVAPAIAADSLTESLNALQQVGKEGAGHKPAIAAWQTVAAASPQQLPQILAAMTDENPLADNWLRAAVDTIAAGAWRPASRCRGPRWNNFCLNWTTRPAADGWHSNG